MRLLALLVCLATPATADVVSARYADPTTRYQHGVLGDAIEWQELRMKLADGREIVLSLPPDRVFEDVAPRLVDVDRDGRSEVIVVETAFDRGARLAIYGPEGLIAATPHIGRAFRWLAPVGAADLDGDGRVEIAYVDQPHLAKILRVWRFDGGRLSQVAAIEGVTNHRIGERDIAGGVRDCGSGPELVVADADWRQVLAVRLERGLRARAIAPHRGRSSFAAALACR